MTFPNVQMFNKHLSKAKINRSPHMNLWLSGRDRHDKTNKVTGERKKMSLRQNRSRCQMDSPVAKTTLGLEYWGQQVSPDEQAGNGHMKEWGGTARQRETPEHREWWQKVRYVQQTEWPTWTRVEVCVWRN
jgi:hypothetical protein